MDFMAPAGKHTGAVLMSWPMCTSVGTSLTRWPWYVSPLAPYSNHGPSASAPWGIIELTYPAGERSCASLDAWPLCVSAMGPR